MKKDLSLECMAIGSLPHKNLQDAMKIVEEKFSALPFWPQLAKLNKNEDMIAQFLESIPGITETSDKVYIENESDEFFAQLEELFMDYEEITSDINSDINSKLLDKYAISRNYSSTIEPFLNLVKKYAPNYAKGQITGPFTLATSLTDKEGKCAFYDETLREVIVKMLSLKALWQIREIKKANPNTTPIIFIDEPSISQLGTSAFITISKEDVVSVLKEVSDVIQANGALSAIHCCGKCDWTVPIESGVSILNLDGFFFAQNLSLFSSEVSAFLNRGGIIAWGIVPTLDKEALERSTLDSMVQKFEEAINYLIEKGIDKDLLLSQSMVTPSCGAGSLTVELSQKAMDLVKNLSTKLKVKYKE